VNVRGQALLEAVISITLIILISVFAMRFYLTSFRRFQCAYQTFEKTHNEAVSRDNAFFSRSLNGIKASSKNLPRFNFFKPSIQTRFHEKGGDLWGETSCKNISERLFVRRLVGRSAY
jgi:hypothetical protein